MKKSKQYYSDLWDSYFDSFDENYLRASAFLLNEYSRSAFNVFHGKAGLIANKIPGLNRSNIATRKMTHFFKGELGHHHSNEVAEIVKTLLFNADVFNEEAGRDPKKTLGILLNDWARGIKASKFNQEGELAKILTVIIEKTNIEPCPTGLGRLLQDNSGGLLEHFQRHNERHDDAHSNSPSA